MVTRIELRIFNQIVTQSILDPKRGIPPKCWNFEDDCVAKLPPGGFIYIPYYLLFMKYDVFRQIADLFQREWS